MLAVGGVAILFWPWHPLGHYIGTNSIPIHFFMVLSATLVAVSWINLRCGCGEMVKSDVFGREEHRRAVFETQRPFVQYGLVGFIVHTVFLQSFFLPFVVLSAAVSGMSLTGVVLALAIVFGTALFCRLFGFSIYLLWGRRRRAPYWLTRAAAIVFLIASALLLPAANPLRIFYELNRSVNGLTNSAADSCSVYTLLMLGANLIWGVLNHTLVNRRMRIDGLHAGESNIREPV